MTWQWLCGFYEGEGGPSYTDNGRRGRPVIKRLRLIITQKERSLLKKCQKFLRNSYGPESRVKVYPLRSSPNYRRGRIAKLMIDGDSALTFARTILPIMQSSKKKRQLRSALRKYGRYK